MAARYQQIADRLQQQIIEGVFAIGKRLPGVRQLSQQFQVSIATILQAHQLLVSRGYIEARERSGYYARLPVVSSAVPQMQTALQQPLPVSSRALAVDLVLSAHDRQLVPLGAAVPSVDLLPLMPMQRATIWAARQGGGALSYAFPGKSALRQQLALRMTALSVPTLAEQILVTGGGQEAIILALRAVTSPGDIVALESPSFPGILHALGLLGLHAIEIPTHPTEGISLESLETALASWPVRACVVVTNHGNPLGCALSDDKKRRLVKLLDAARVPLIEDDIYGDLCFGQERPRPAKCFDQDGGVIYCSSFSKTMAPGLRVGWIQPGRYLAAVLQQKYFMNIATATVPQLAAAHLLEQGGYDRYLRVVRQRYQTLVTQMSAAVSRYFPAGTAISQPVGGFVLWVQLPKPCDTLLLFYRAREAGIHLAPGKMFSTTDRYGHCLRLNCANPWSGKIESAIRRLGELARDQLADAASGRHPATSVPDTEIYL